MVDSIKKYHYTSKFFPYIQEVHKKMLPTKKYILPYIKNKTVVDWGAGPGHRAKILSSWGADSVQCWDPNMWCKHVFNKYYSSNQLTWLDNLENINCDTLYIGGVTLHAGPEPHKWFEDILDKVKCKYLVTTWDIENTETDLDRIFSNNQNRSWLYFNILGYNTQVNAYDIYTKNKTIEPSLFKKFPVDFDKNYDSIKLLIHVFS